MRIKFSGVFLCLAIVFMCSSVYAKEPRTGLSIIPTFNSLGLGIRSWRTAQFGWELQGNTSFDGDYKTGLAKLMYSPSTDKSRFYLFGGLGGFSYSGDNWSGSSSYYAIGTGWEWLKGIRKNQGASFE
ncbi:MAG: hypothetical protein FP827_03935, partial [Candidatus Omnitrophica bacterium]|nr:hypothetical protein [Candidatus Omnitrophota bacterium]